MYSLIRWELRRQFGHHPRRKIGDGHHNKFWKASCIVQLQEVKSVGDSINNVDVDRWRTVPRFRQLVSGEYLAWAINGDVQHLLDPALIAKKTSS